MVVKGCRLTLGELNSTSRTTQTVFLSFFHSRIASQESIRTQRWEILFVEAHQRSRKSHSDRAGLADGSTTTHPNENINLISVPDVVKRFHNESPFRFVYEILFEGSIVNRDFPGPVLDANSSYRRFATARSKAITANFVFLNYCNHGIVLYAE
jgi:hypothetical protein